MARLSFLTASRNGNPRKVAPSTSYSAQGLAAPPKVDSELGSSRPVIIRETVPELSSPFSRQQAYAKMLNDAGVDVSMRVAKTPVLGAEFFMEPYSTSPQDAEISDFCWANLAEGMSAPFINSIEDVLHFYEDGYAVLEKVYENRAWAPNRKAANTREYTMLKKLAVRPTSTLKNIEYDNNGGPVKVTQGAIQADGKPVDKDLTIDKLIIFTLNRKGGDLTGKSLLRTAYPHWYYKNHFYKIDAIQKERHSLGVPKGRLLPGWTPKDRNILRTLLKNIRSNEEAFMILTPNVDVEFAEIHGNLVNVLESAVHHNMMIMMNVMAQFLVLGVEASSGGGRATAGSQSDIFMKALRYVANYIADCINMYLIPELVVWNYPTVNFPKLKVRNIGETRDLQMLGAAIANVISQGGVQMDDPTEAWIRRVFDMPAADPSTTREPTAPTTGKGSTKQQRDKIGGNAGSPNK